MDLLCQKLKCAPSLQIKHQILDAEPKILQKKAEFEFLLKELSLESALVLKQLFFLDPPLDWNEKSVEKWKSLLEELLKTDRFYHELGGLIGYQQSVFRLLAKETKKESSLITYHSPSFIDLRENNDSFKKGVEFGLFSMDQLGEIYPIGGAADRLHLVDEMTSEELPAAKLPFMGRPLLEALIYDIQAREHLYFQTFGKKILTPIAMMTSWEKENHRHVLELCEEKKYWGRPKELFRFFSQPLVPVVDAKGKWVMAGPLKPLLKPGGHGVLWKLARDEGIFDWFSSLGRTKAIVRQINNPAAGLDGGLLALFGIGSQGKYHFGFASCPRLVCSAVGMNVLIEKENQIVLTNVEYCEFEQAGIQDVPIEEGKPFSRFSSNTNILYADLESIREAVEKEPFPGLLINPKTAQFKDVYGNVQETVFGRLESTMQNIADVFKEEKSNHLPLKTERTFATYNDRHKTIAVAKKAYIPGKSLMETPECCFYECMVAARELLESCQISLPQNRTLEESLCLGPSFAFLYHPSLGPLYSLIREKIRKGKLELESELVLEISDLLIENLFLKGSLQIKAEQIMGHFGSDGLLSYSKNVAACRLKNVTIDNQGVDWKKSSPQWKCKWTRCESLLIDLKGRSLFVAEGVHFSGSHHFIVEDGMMMKVTQKDGSLQIEMNQLS